MRSAFIAVCVVLAGANGSAFAQGGGVLVGVNFANVKADVGGPSVNFDSRTGLVAGIFGAVPIAPRVALEPGVFFSSQGAKLDGGEFGIGTATLNYLQVPVPVRMSAPLGSSAALRVFAGPYVGIRLSAKLREPGATSDTDVKEDIEQFDAGAVFGAGVEVHHFLVDVRYSLGLKNIGKNPEDGETLKNRVVSILAGITF